MENEQNLTLKVGEGHHVTLQSRGATGLQLLYRCDDDSTVQIQRKEFTPADTAKELSTNVGGSMPAVFQIQALKEGETKVTFYETRPWDKSFKEIIQKQLTIKVAK
jgi:predicted secreted protein